MVYLTTMHPLSTQVMIHMLWAGFGLLFFCKYASTSSVWNMPWPVRGYRSYMSVMPMRFDSPAGLTSLNLSFSGIKTKSICPNREIHIVIKNGGLPLVELEENSLPENFVAHEDSSIKLVIKPGQIAELALTRPPPGPWYIVGYLKGFDMAIKQKGLISTDPCRYLYMAMAKLSAPAESTTILPGEEIKTTPSTKGSLFSFTVPPNTINFELQVTSCSPGPCNLSLSHLTFKPSDSKSLVQDCSDSDNSTSLSSPCVLHVSSPALNDVHMIKIKYMGDDVDSGLNKTVIFKVVLEACPLFRYGLATKSCGITPQLDRIQSPIALTTRFGVVHSSTVSLVADLTATKVTAIPFTMLEPNDIGGTLKWQLHAVFYSQTNVSMQQVCGGLIHNELPDASLPELELCTADIPGSLNLTHSFKDGDKAQRVAVKRYVPYPQAGQWHIVLQAHCYAGDSLTPVDCGNQVLVEMMLEVHSCVDEKCSGHGTCEFSTSGTDLVSFSACKCDADFRGYGCTDDRDAQTKSVQLAGAFLLTMSNLFFVPAIILGVRRGFLLEAFVYFFTMFFSTFYHACDGVRIQKYRICITQYDVLQLADFFGSACSLWFTLIAMARIRQKHVTSLLQIAGLFGLFVGVIYDRTSLCVIAVPIFSGLATITCSWGVKMYRRKCLYPSWRRYVFFLAPGVVLAVVGGASFAFLETEANYKYLHSVWHMCVALSIVLLLPPRPPCPSKYGLSETSLEMSQPAGIPYSQDIS